MTQAFAPHRSETDGVRRSLPPPRTAPVPGLTERVRMRETEVRLGRVRTGSAAAYLLGWAAVVLVAWLVVCSAVYWILLHTGTLASVSRSAATILDAHVGSNGLLSAFTWPHALLAFVLSGLALALAWFVSAMGAVLVHNALAGTVRGPRVQLKQ